VTFFIIYSNHRPAAHILSTFAGDNSLL